MDELTDKIVRGITLIDTACDGQVILSQNDNAMAPCVICVKDKDLYNKLATKFGLDPVEDSVDKV